MITKVRARIGFDGVVLGYLIAAAMFETRVRGWAIVIALFVFAEFIAALNKSEDDE